MLMEQIRADYHRQICREIIRLKRGKDSAQYPNFADSCSTSSVSISLEILRSLNHPLGEGPVTEQNAGKRFELITRDYLEKAFGCLNHLRPGAWSYSVKKLISSYSQYEHLAYIEAVLKQDKTLCSTLKGDYIVRPDIVISRSPETDKDINRLAKLLNENEEIATFTPLRARNQKQDILHASISCKWTIRSDRSQNTRTEALNLIRHRKGNLPHIVAVTAEPLPTRIAALALGTGDMDCVYHFALRELRAAVASANNVDQADILQTMVDGRRLRDISDLPFDLAI